MGFPPQAYFLPQILSYCIVIELLTVAKAAHISLPGLGDNMPASLNPNVIKILRDEWSYDGIIISDCLEMDGVRLKYGTEGSAVLALKVYPLSASQTLPVISH